MDARNKAQELADALKASPEYLRLESARETIEQHQSAKIMMRDFQNKQMELQKKQMEGEEITEKQAEELKKLYEVLAINPYIRELFEAEYEFSNLMMEIQETITNSIKIENDEEESDDASTEDNLSEKMTKKLWTPGD